MAAYLNNFDESRFNCDKCMWFFADNFSFEYRQRRIVRDLAYGHLLFNTEYSAKRHNLSFAYERCFIICTIGTNKSKPTQSITIYLHLISIKPAYIMKDNKSAPFYIYQLTLHNTIVGYWDVCPSYFVY